MRKIFLRGLVALAPITITVAIIIWLFRILEETFKAPIIELIGYRYYFPGLGIIVAFLIIFIVGAVINTWLISKIYDAWERLLRKIPVIKTLYSAVTDFMGFFHVGQKQGSERVVCVDIDGKRLLGLVTRENFEDLPDGIGKQGDILVYLPMSYQIGGYSVVLPRRLVTPIDMNMEQAMRFILIAGAQKSK